MGKKKLKIRNNGFKGLKKKRNISVSRLQKYDRVRLRREVLVGTFLATRSDFGFVAIEGSQEEYFISARDRNSAFDKDKVEIEPYPNSTGKRKEARIVSVIERNKKTLVGSFAESRGFGFVIPDSVLINEDIYIPKGAFNGAKQDDKVVVEITGYGDASQKPEGRIIEVLGHKDDKGVDILSIIRDFDIEPEFPEKVLRQADNVAKPVTVFDIDFRKDYRDLVTVTIDGEDTKDFDDAISIEQVGEQIRLGVHIADVANYVQEGSALDKEALKRGTSIYPVDRVIPMLPQALSNGICSLNEGEDRLTITCMMIFDKDGEMLEYRIEETVIRVKMRLTYQQVYEALSKVSNQLKPIMPMLKLMKKLAKKLKKKREKRGAVDFDLKESQIIFDSENKPIDIVLKQRNIATGIIEEFMLAANETVARHFFEKGTPFVYRIHEHPDKEKIQVLADLCKKLGYSLRGYKAGISAKQIRHLLERVKDSPEEKIVSKMALRSMQQAKYGTECIGHFGLAADYYCHFTSPIRRYPDLQIHRIIRESLHGKLNGKREEHYHNILEEVSRRSSITERKAVDIERKSDKIKKAEYMQEFLGEIFEGFISGVTSRGLFVELENTVEGMVSVDSMTDDFYYFEEGSLSLVGERRGLRYTLGNPVKIQVVKSDKQTGNIDFVLVD